MNKPTEFKRISVRLIDPSPFGIRRKKDAQLLEGSMRKFGLQSPVKVRPKAQGRFEIIFGDRRLEEAKKLRLKEIDVIVEKVDDSTALLEHVIENCVRKDFDPVEEAIAYQKLKKIGYSTINVAKLVGKSPPLVSNRLALLKLPQTVQEYIIEERLAPVLAQRISQTIPPKFQEHVAKTIVDNHYEYFQGHAYIDALSEQYELEKVSAGFTVKAENPDMPEIDVKEVLDRRRTVIEEKLKGAFAVDATNIGNLEIWKLAIRIQPKIGAYSQYLFMGKEKIIEALRKDLERLTYPKQNIRPLQEAEAPKQKLNQPRRQPPSD